MKRKYATAPRRYKLKMISEFLRNRRLGKMMSCKHCRGKGPEKVSLKRVLGKMLISKLLVHVKRELGKIS